MFPRILVLTALVLAVLSPGAGAAERAITLPRVAVELPPLGARAAAVAPATWIVGARPDARTDSLARRHRARRIGRDGAYAIPSDRARAFADDLERAGLLVWAEPDHARRRAAAFDAAPNGWARAAVVPAHSIAPTRRPSIGVVDSFVDGSHPDLAGLVTHVNATPSSLITDPHGTQVASAAAALANGSGVMGVMPGARIVSFGVPDAFGCSESTDGIAALTAREVDVIVLSYGSPDDCFAEYLAIAGAIASDIVVVAAAGNEFLEGNPVTYPAAWPHVVSVAASGLDGRSAYFSSANAAVDLAAPGESVPVAIPLGFDDDGVPDGITTADGTSFAAPIVAGAAAWVRAARPRLEAGQVADVLRFSAADIGRAGWDRDSGFGRVDLPAAISERTPAADPLEPNDFVGFVNGAFFESADDYVWSGNGRGTLRASVDLIEDPSDVYRIRIAPKSRLRIRLRPLDGGDPELLVYRSSARFIGDRRAEIGRSLRAAGKTESLVLQNDSADARSALVAVEVYADADQLNAAYRLEFTRLRRR